tara:strand:+ start:90 stop:311 length:222 start_codon:yes stop_codon:yes gene_type:complete
MEKYTFIVSKEKQEFVSIIKVEDNNLNSFIGLDLDLYSALTTDEKTARANFTVTNHLPSDKFEELLNDIKEQN